jgi:peptide/nickel transport system permease protein
MNATVLSSPAPPCAICARVRSVLRQLATLPPGPALAAAFLLLLVAIVLAPGLFAGADPWGVAPREAFQPPSWAHWFGTDASGRDLWARVVYGARESLTIGVAATALSMTVAIVLGMTAGLGGRLLDRAIGSLLNVLFAFPALLVALVLVAVFGAGLGPVIVATGLGCSPGYARMVRAQVLAVRGSGYIEAARVLGHSPWRIIARQILPNAMRPLLVTVTLGVGQIIVWASALSFLGLGKPPPAAEWGTLLSVGRDFVALAWWMTFFPGLFIVLTTLSTTVLGRWLQRRLEGRTP